MYLITSCDFASGDESCRLTDSIEWAFRIFREETGSIFIDLLVDNDMKTKESMTAYFSVNGVEYRGIPAPSDNIKEMFLLIDGLFSVTLKEIEVE